ncbi:MAG TPA: hypothetical protein VEV45_17655 [Streptosporangiaceae bacterium]|nr:hypothetical protein [Streptosporangiaceae bacterium]
MVAFGLFDLGITVMLGLLLVGSIAFLVPRNVGRLGRAVRVWPLVVSLAGIGLFIDFNVAYFNGTDPVISSPTRLQVIGTWVGNGGARLVVGPDGTFSASRLPSYVGQPTDFPDMLLGNNPLSGSGTWVIGPGEFGGPPESVIFTFAGSTQNFDLQAETVSLSGGPALFYYLGDPDDWSRQYAFTRQ